MDLICTVCSHLNAAGAQRCEFCGALLGDDLAAGLQGGAVCPTCQTPYLPGEMICMECGTQLPPIAVLPPDLPKKVDPNAGPVEPAKIEPPAVRRYRLAFRNPDAVFDLKFDQNEIIVGRAESKSGFVPEVDLTALGGMDLGVSRKHARFLLAGQKILLEDLESKNFTYHNRQRLAPHNPVEVKTGDEIRFGGLTAIFGERES